MEKELKQNTLLKKESQIKSNNKKKLQNNKKKHIFISSLPIQSLMALERKEYILCKSQLIRRSTKAKGNEFISFLIGYLQKNPNQKKPSISKRLLKQWPMEDAMQTILTLYTSDITGLSPVLGVTVV